MVRLAEVLGRYSKLGPTGVRIAKATESARQNRRSEPWTSPEVTVTTVRRMTPEEIEAMVADYRAGIGSWRLARKYGVSDSTVLARLKAAGVEVEQREHRQAVRDHATSEMARLSDSGWSQGQIAERFGISRQAVCMRLKRAADKGLIER